MFSFSLFIGIEPTVRVRNDVFDSRATLEKEMSIIGVVKGGA